MKLRVIGSTSRVRWLGWAGIAAVGILALAGCDDTVSSKQVKARPPAATPAPSPAFVHESLPFPEHTVSLASLYDTRPSIDLLIDKVQVIFNTAQKEYKSGDFDKAHADYDRAVALMLASGFQVDSDPRLSDLFDQIGETLHSYERGAQQDAAEEEEDTGTPAPIDALADMTLPPGDPRLAAQAEKELMRVSHDLPLTVNDSVLQYLSYFTTTRGRATVEHGLDRSGRYNDMIRRVLKEEGVPQDLMYLAQAESAFQPTAVSRAGARGLWQFMPFRGEEYDLDRTYYVDERSDPEKATRAAARHMRDLYDMFGDWYLVMAAYNSGPMNVVKAVERTGYADFWELQKRHALPKQTQNYVPIIIALALVAKDPTLYGVQVAPEKPAPVDVIHPAHAIDLRLVADATGADLDDLRELNPEMLRSVTPNDPTFELRLPAGYGEKLLNVINQVPADKWTSWRLHTVEQGETLSDIARRYRVTVPAIESANHLEAHAVVPAGFMLNVPAAPPAVRLVHYRVVRGDTLEGIAERFDVSVSQLKRWNNIHGASVPRGSRLKIYAGGSPDDSSHSSAAAKSAVHPAGNRNAAVQMRKVSAAATSAGDKSATVEHHVKQGETLYSIAHAYKTSVESIRQANSFLGERPLKAGDVLTIQR
ncbi:MAG TPA: LysM peptidoglycan-binding domain-containing protein [Candidatus Acidoferrales bacterium]